MTDDAAALIGLADAFQCGSVCRPSFFYEKFNRDFFCYTVPSARTGLGARCSGARRASLRCDAGYGAAWETLCALFCLPPTSSRPFRITGALRIFGKVPQSEHLRFTCCVEYVDRSSGRETPPPPSWLQTVALRGCLAQLEACPPSRPDFVALCYLLSVPVPWAHADYAA